MLMISDRWGVTEFDLLRSRDCGVVMGYLSAIDSRTLNRVVVFILRPPLFCHGVTRASIVLAYLWLLSLPGSRDDSDP